MNPSGIWFIVAKSKRWPSTNTSATRSPPPPAMPNGALWQPAHEFESGAEMRLKFRGKTSGADGSESGAPVPLVSGRPPPSCRVQLATNSRRPCSSTSRSGMRNSSPSFRCLATATSRPIEDCASVRAHKIANSTANAIAIRRTAGMETSRGTGARMRKRHGRLPRVMRRNDCDSLRRSSWIDPARPCLRPRLERHPDDEWIVDAKYGLLLERVLVALADSIDAPARRVELLEGIEQDQDERLFLDDHAVGSAELTVALEQRQAVGKTR